MVYFCAFAHADILKKNARKSGVGRGQFDAGINGISNSNWTEWTTIQGVIERVISKSDERKAGGRFEITSTITP